MARKHWIVFSFLGLGLVGCVPQEKYNAARLSLDAANERLAQSEAQSKAAEAAAEAYRRQLEALNADQTNREGRSTNLATALATLQAEHAELQRRYEEAMNNQGKFVPLTPELNTALTDFANQNPDLVEFDSSKGVVKFKSDVTFNTGSAEVKNEARNAIARFAQILNSPAAAGYELQVAGHTDSQRVSNPNTIKQGHKDNWYLSSHRAISVGKELQSQRVEPRRIAVVGYADQHPVASNANEAGRQQNRRVEVLILPTQVRSTPAPTGAAEATAGAGEGNDANKDSAGVNVDRGAAFDENK
jgi:chemotaxis protein MotB